MNEIKKYKLDKSIITSMSFKETDDQVEYWENKSEYDRLDAACFIINQIFGVPPSDKVDFALTDKRKHNGESS